MRQEGWSSFFALGLCSTVGCGPGGGTGRGAAAGACGSVPVEDTDLQQCTSCSPAGACTSAAPLDACCNWVAAPRDPLIDGTELHRYTAPAGTLPALTCLASVPPPGAPQPVTLTGYVGLFSSGQDSAGVEVDVFEEKQPNTDGSLAPTPVGTYTTTTSDPVAPTDTRWNAHCSDGCSLRQYTIPGVFTETPLVIKTSDAGSAKWATRYEYNVYFANADVRSGTVSYDAEAVAGSDLASLGAMAGQTFQADTAALVGEVHDCNDVRLGGATVGSNAPGAPRPAYFTSDESDPLLSLEQVDTSVLGLYAFAFVDVQASTPVRVSAVGLDPDHAGQALMLGTYTVQVVPGAVTALVLRGRRPWQP